jgi:hypothetical protein
MTMPGLQLRRRLHLALVATAGLTLMVVTASCASTAAVSHSSGPQTTGAAVRLDTQAAVASGPRYFLDIVQASGAVSGGLLQVRRSATGALVQQPGSLALGLAPLGGSKFVVAELAGNGCASALYRARISAAGQLGPLSRFGPRVHGEVVSLAAAADGRAIGFLVAPCSKSASGFLGVLNVRTGQVRVWGDVNVEGSAGDISACCSLSLSANGRLAAFSGGVSSGQRVWVLSTSARAGTLAQRSRVVLSRPSSSPVMDSVLLSPDARSFYVCTVSTKGTVSAHHSVTQTSVITARRTDTGARINTVATLRASGVTFESQFFGCQMAAIPGGSFLLVPYSIRYARVTTTGPRVSAVRIDVRTKAASRISFRLPGSAGMSVATGIAIAW